MSINGISKELHSEITDESLIVIAQGLHFLTKVSLNFTQCTDAGLLSFAKGKCRHVLKDFHMQHKSWSDGYAELITKEGAKEFQTAMKLPSSISSIGNTLDDKTFKMIVYYDLLYLVVEIMIK